METIGPLSECSLMLPIDKKSSEFKRRNTQWEAPSMPMAAYNPHLVPDQETPLVIGKDCFLDHEIPAVGFV